MKKKPKEWTKIFGPFLSGQGSSWEHVSGWAVYHCGGHSAIWPYFLVSPDGRRVVSDSGYGFKTMRIAKGVVEGLAGGHIQLAQVNSQGSTVVDNWWVTFGVTAFGRRRVAT